MNDVLYEFKYKTQSLIFLKDKSCILVKNSFIINRGTYTIIDDSSLNKIFLIRYEDGHIAAVMIDLEKKNVFYTYKKGKQSRSRIKPLI